MGSATKSTLKPLPMLGLSRVGRRKHKAEKRAPKLPPRRTSPRCKVPLPTSFVDVTASLLAQRERAFLDSSSSSEDEEEKEAAKKRRSERETKKRSEKEQIRRRLAEAKLKLSHRFDVSETIVEEDNDAVMNESSQPKEMNDVIQKSSSDAAASRHFENVAVKLQNNDERCNGSSSSSGIGGQASPPTDENLLRSTVDDCFREVMDPSRVSVKELLHRVASRLHRGCLTKSERAAARSRITEHLLSWQKNQEKPERLLQVIQSEFEIISTTRDGLRNCSLDQFLKETQKYFATPFSIEAQGFVEAQLRDLVRKFQKTTTEKENPNEPALNAAPKATAHPVRASTETCALQPIPTKNSSKTHAEDIRQSKPSEARNQRDTKGTLVVPSNNVTTQRSQVANTSAFRLVEPTTKRTIEEVDNNSLSCGADCIEVGEDLVTVPKQRIARNPPKPIRAKKTASKRGDEGREVNKRHPPSLPPEHNSTIVENNETKIANERRDESKRPKTQQYLEAEAPAKKVRKAPNKRKSCSLCLKCPCTTTSRNSVGTTTDELSQTDGAIEKALIRRLAKLETVADQYEEQTETVRRTLKKHRRDMWKKREDLLKRAGEQIASKRITTYFLPDVDELDDQFSKRKWAKRGSESVAKAKARLMKSQRPEPKQRTLTQMVDGSEAELAEESMGLNAEVCQATEDPALSDIEEELSCDEDEAALTNGDVKVRRVLLTKSKNGCLWDGLKSGSFQSAFDKLFDEEVAVNDGDGVEQLLELMMSSPKKQERPSMHQESPSNLSFRGKKLMEGVTEKTLADSTNLHAIEELCPQWKENVVFAMAQRESTDITDAIQNVQQEKIRLTDLREKFLQAIDKRVTTLDFYEQTLDVSATRTGSLPSEVSVAGDVDNFQNE